MALRINEIFYSIQGESTWAGLPCLFVRLAGCPLRCHYCDTAYAFREGAARSVESIASEVIAHPCSLIEITGGEPLAQREVHALIAALLDASKTVLIETSGAIDTSDVDPRAQVILDIKTPGSGESGRTVWGNLARLRQHDEVKFVITSREDYEFARDVLRRERLEERCRSVLFSPAHSQPGCSEVRGTEGLSPRELASWILADGLPVRMQLQLHKFIWEPLTRGV